MKEEDIDRSLERLFVTRYKLGIVGDSESAYDAIPYSENNAPAHSRLALRAAEEGLTLLKNDGCSRLTKPKSIPWRSSAPMPTAARLSRATTAAPPPGITRYSRGCGNIWTAARRSCTPRDATYSRNRWSPAPSATIAQPRPSARRRRPTWWCCASAWTRPSKGNRGTRSTETAAGDKPDLRLPGLQNQLMEKILAWRQAGHRGQSQRQRGGFISRTGKGGTRLSRPGTRGDGGAGPGPDAVRRG